MIISDIRYSNNCKDSDSIIFDWKNLETEEEGQFIASGQDKEEYENLENCSHQGINDYLVDKI